MKQQHQIAVGARYIRRDFMINFLHPLDKHDSGVQSKLYVNIF